MHEVLVNRLGGLSLPRKGVVRLTDSPDMTLDVYRGHKTTIQQQQPSLGLCSPSLKMTKLVDLARSTTEITGTETSVDNSRLVDVVS